MRAVVTGAAGFIGSTIVDALLARGDVVVGIDCLTPYYDPARKRANLAGASASPRFSLVEADLRTEPLDALIEAADVVFHQAGQPGVRLSWDDGFAEYDGCNVLATQRLLEAARRVGVPRLVYASSSSIYGEATSYPTTETDLPAPHSPYGVTKLAGEHLCTLYGANWGLSTVALRYFTVYGPRQRPDMAFHRFVAAGLAAEPIGVFGTGEQIRDFTFVGDVVSANLLAGAADLAPGTVMNVAGGGSTTVNEVIGTISGLLERPLVIERRPAQPGDVERTGGSIERAARLLGWSPTTSLRDGLAAQVAWHTGATSALEAVPA
jgi:UDP-glucuronate 4-epimerase